MLIFKNKRFTVIGLCFLYKDIKNKRVNQIQKSRRKKTIKTRTEIVK